MNPDIKLEQHARENYWLKMDLLARGWSSSTIKRILGNPDVTTRRYGGGTFTYYDPERVEVAENSRDDWRKSEKRAAASKAAAANRTAKLEQAIDELEVEIKVLPIDQLLKAACGHYNERQMWRALERGYSDWNSASIHDSVEFLARITTNYIRHQLTDYDQEIERLVRRQPGAEELYERLKGHIMFEVEWAYPDLEQQIATLHASQSTSMEVAAVIQQVAQVEVQP